MWHMSLAYASSSVEPNTAAIGCNHQSTCLPQLKLLCLAALVPMNYPGSDEGSSDPYAVIEYNCILAPTLPLRTQTQDGRNQRRD